jgi:hypothetical protein
MDVPASMRFFANALSEYSTNTIQLQSLNQTTLSTRSGATQLTVALPVSAMVNLKSLQLHADFQTYGLAESSAGAADSVQALIPRCGIASAVDSVHVSLGGISADNAPNNYALQHLVKQGQECTINKYMSDVKVLENGCIEPYGTIDTATNGQRKSLVMTNFLGFMEAEPEFMPMDLLPEVRLQVRLATDNSCIPVQFEGAQLGAAAINANPNWTKNNCRLELQNIYFTCDVCSVGDGLYQAMAEKMLEKEGSLDIPFKSYNLNQVAADSSAVSVRGSVSSLSLDCLRAFARNEETVANGAAYEPWSSQQPPVECSGSTTFSHQQANCNFISQGLSSWQFRANSSPAPLFTPDAITAYSQQVAAYQRGYSKVRGSLSGSQEMFLNNQWCAIAKYCHDLDSVREVSGLDLRSIQAAVEFNATGTGYKRQYFLMSEQTSMCRVGAGRAVSILQ